MRTPEDRNRARIETGRSSGSDASRFRGFAKCLNGTPSVTRYPTKVQDPGDEKDSEAIRKENSDRRMRNLGGRGRVFEAPGISQGLSPGPRYTPLRSPIFPDLTRPNPIRIASQRFPTLRIRRAINKRPPASVRASDDGSGTAGGDEAATMVNSVPGSESGLPL